MFSWKRQRKEEEPSHVRASAEVAVECAPLGSSPAAVVSAAAGLLIPSSGTSSIRSEPSSVDECMQPAPAPCHSSSNNDSMSRRSIELATRAASGVLVPAQAQHAGQASCRSSVRAKAAYFEALIRCNTTTHIQCSTEGVHCSSCPASGGGGGGGAPAASSSDVAQQLPACEGDSILHYLEAPFSSSASSATSAAAAAAAAAVSGASWEEECWDDCSEVHMVLRMPRQRAPPGGGRYGSVADMEALVEQLQAALEVKEQQRKAAVDAYNRRLGECENLQRVVKELIESRSKVVQQRATLAERYGELQQEYHRMLRIADLSRTVSKENLAKTSRTRSELRRVQLELHATRNHAQHLSEKHKKVRVENAKLKEKVTLLERMDFEEMQESECKKHFTRYRLAETY